MFSIPEGKKYLVLFFVMTGLLFLSSCDIINPDLNGSIDINSSPTGATVYLDGVDTGQITPIILTDVPAGTHTVKLELYLYESKEDTNVVVTAGETKYLNWGLTLANTQTLTLQPGSEGKDASVNNAEPDENFGDLSLVLGYISPTYSKHRAYLYFDISSLPLDVVVTFANIKLYQYDSTGSIPIGLYPVTGDWEEDLITWNNQPTSSSEAESITDVSASTVGTWIAWDIRDLLQGWLDDTIPNKGVLLKPVNEPAAHDTYFRSSDYLDSGYHPQLVIDYYVP